MKLKSVIDKKGNGNCLKKPILGMGFFYPETYNTDKEKEEKKQTYPVVCEIF